MKKKWYTQWDECGKRIQAQRKRMGMSREQLAEQIDISVKKSWMDRNRFSIHQR